MPGRFTWTSWSRRGATTMKMMSRTRTTSTSGVTFMSGVTSPALRRLSDALTANPFDPPLLGLVTPPLEQVDELASRARQTALLLRDLLREVVEGQHGRDGDGESERGLDECLADASGNRGQPTGAGRRDALEGRDDADHRAEESDEGRHRADRGQDRHA